MQEELLADDDLNSRDDDSHDRHLRHFDHLSESNRNFVESLVDDILARNH